jgi:carboxy-cis,cis-muconate cyclase
LYIATTGAFQSYAVTDDLSLTYQSNITLSSGCSNGNFIIGSTASPYTVFGVPYSGGCSGLAISVSDSGALQTTVANLTYSSAGGVHGLALSSDNKFVYSADDMGNAVWSHSFDSTTGVATELQYLAAPTGANPRHLATHPNGKWVYVIFEELNELAVYSRDDSTGLLEFTNTTYSLLPSGEFSNPSDYTPSTSRSRANPTIGYTNTSSYWADEVQVSNSSSLSPKYLITGTRSRTTSIPGHVSAFALDADTGAITSQLFLLPTTGSGGSANSVTPSLFSEEIFAITDSGSNFIEVWQIAADGASAAPVAHVALSTGPANVVWYS